MKYSIPITLTATFALLFLVGCDETSSEAEAIWYEPNQSESDSSERSNEEQASSVATTEKEMTDQEQQEPGEKKESERYGIGASLDGFRPFPDDDPWNQKVTDAKVDPNSDKMLAYIGLDGRLHPDFGSGTWNGAPIGIPYIVVPGDQPHVEVEFVAYGDESDPGPYPLPFNTPVEGAPNQDGDRHAIIVDRDNRMLYELFRAFPEKQGLRWRADSGAVFNLKTNTDRPEGWTSADAAGLPIFPGLVRYDEVVEQGEIRHALRFTLSDTRRAYVPPASHWASDQNHPLLPPLGMRVRLRQDFDISGFSKNVQVILRCLKTYGMILADNGSDWFLSGAPDERWDNDELRELKKVKAGDLEILKMEGLVTPFNR